MGYQTSRTPSPRNEITKKTGRLRWTRSFTHYRQVDGRGYLLKKEQILASQDGRGLRPGNRLRPESVQGGFSRKCACQGEQKEGQDDHPEQGYAEGPGDGLGELFHGLSTKAMIPRQSLVRQPGGLNAGSVSYQIMMGFCSA